MSKKMLINATHAEENRVAIVENGILTELGVEVAGREPTKGNIYKAAVVRVEPGLQAAFVDYGAERLGFLQIDEVNAAVIKPDFKLGGRPRINDLLQRGQEILVQIVKEERGTKGAALTTYLSLAGRYMVLMPGTPTRGVSRKAEDDKQRKQIKKALSSLNLPANIGCIARTAALDQTREELERDYLYLMRLYENIQSLEKKVKAPALIYKESNLVIRSIRDYFTTDMDEVLIDDPEVFRETREFFEVVMPDHIGLVKLHQERRPIFSRYQIEEQIEMISRNKVPLPSGGSIVIDTTEALVAIDVNSGKMAGESNVEGTATRTNLEAAEEVARQLRLRDLGGLIVIDFIDMRERKHIREVEDLLRAATSRDKARITIGNISQFGMLEMSRQRIKPALTEGAFRTCPHCQGAGRIRSVETLAISVLRRLHASLAKGQIAEVEVQLARHAASYLLNEKREDLVEMERLYQVDIQITGRTSFLPDQVDITLQKREKEKAVAEYVEAKLQQLPVLPVARPVEPVEEEASESSAAGEGTGKAGKKRRRKRKRKAEGEVGLEPAVEQVAVPTEGEAGETVIPAAAETELPAGETAAKKKRRRRGRKKAGETDHAAEAVAAVPAVEPMVAAVVVPVPTLEEESAAEPVARKKRRRGKKKTVDGEYPDEAGTGMQQEEPIVATAVVPEPVHAEMLPGEMPDRKKRHRSRKQTSEVEQAVEAEPEAPVKESPLSSAFVPETAHEDVTSNEAAAKKKRRRRGRKKHSEQPIEAVLGSTPAEEPHPAVAKPAIAAIESPPASVKKPRQARRQPVSQPAEVLSAPAIPAEDLPATAAQANEAPLTAIAPKAPRSRRKKTEEDILAGSVGTPTTIDKSPRRKRTTRGKAERPSADD